MIVNMNTYTDADFSQSFAYQTAQGSPIDITGETMHLHARAAADDPTIFLELTTVNGGIIITDAALGAFSLYVSQAVLRALPVGNYVQSLILVDAQFHRKDLWRGSLVHAAGPTRWTPGTP